MKTLLLIFALFLQVGIGRADNRQLLHELDQVISEKGNYVGQKEETIAALKQQLAVERDSDRMMKLTEDIFREYKVFKFDSAMVYANRGLALARQLRNASYVAQFSICRSEILAIGGLYTEALSNLEQVDTTVLNRKQLFDYHQTHVNIYMYWANYCNDREYAPQYMANAPISLRMPSDTSIPVTNSTITFWASITFSLNPTPRRHATIMKWLSRVAASSRECMP